jgi:hypothetical protein
VPAFAGTVVKLRREAYFFLAAFFGFAFALAFFTAFFFAAISISPCRVSPGAVFTEIKTRLQEARNFIVPPGRSHDRGRARRVIDDALVL